MFWKMVVLKRKIQMQQPEVFSCEFCGISKNNFFTEHLQTTASEDYCRKLAMSLCSLAVNLYSLKQSIEQSIEANCKPVQFRTIHWNFENKLNNLKKGLSSFFGILLYLSFTSLQEVQNWTLLIRRFLLKSWN